MREFKIYDFQINELVNFVNDNILTKFGAPLVNYFNQLRNQEILQAEGEVQANEQQQDEQAPEPVLMDAAVGEEQQPVIN